MGLAFKPNIDDLRESPAKFIVNKVLQDDKNGDYFIVEPNILNHKIFKLTNYKDASEISDIIVILVAHKQFINLKFGNDKVVLDFAGVFKSDTQKSNSFIHSIWDFRKQQLNYKKINK